MENALDSKQETPVSGRSIGMTYGLYAGLVSAIIFVVISLASLNPFGGGLNYIGTVASIVLLVLAHKKFKDSGDSFMSYGQGVGIGFWFILISSLISLAVMYIYINFVDYSPMQLMLDEQLTKMQEQGQPEEAIEMAATWTKNLFWPLAIFMGLFFGMIIVLIVTIFTQKKNPTPAF